jgi:alkylated DNA repair dioxygenase AlkB
MASAIIAQTGRSQITTHIINAQIYDHMNEFIRHIDDVLVSYPEIKIGKKVYTQKCSAGMFTSSKTYINKNIYFPHMGESQQLLDVVNTSFGGSFNTIVVYKYANGSEYISKHVDEEEREHMDTNVGILVMFLGAIRKFRIRNRMTKEIHIDIPTSSTTCVQMNGDFGRDFTHETPIEKSIKDVHYTITFQCR